jgi:hypothetical protein
MKKGLLDLMAWLWYNSLSIVFWLIVFYALLKPEHAGKWVGLFLKGVKDALG